MQQTNEGDSHAKITEDRNNEETAPTVLSSEESITTSNNNKKPSIVSQLISRCCSINSKLYQNYPNDHQQHDKDDELHCASIGSHELVENISHSTADTNLRHLSCNCNQHHDNHGITENHIDTKSQISKYLLRHSTFDIQQQVLKSLHQSFLMIESAQKHCHLSQPFGGAARWNPCKSWSLPRLKSTAFGVLSSLSVLIIRLYLDSSVHTTYLIHSIVIFFDMVLIHVFTNSVWLSIGGEIVTFIHFLAFHFTKETVFELMETTFIAMLCSFHLIISRNKHFDHANELVHNMENLQMTSMHLLQHMESLNDIECGLEIRRTSDRTIHSSDVVALEDIKTNCSTKDSKYIENQDSDHLLCKIKEKSIRQDHEESTSMASNHDVDETPKNLFGHQHNQKPWCKNYLKMCGEHFYEHFLDGSAGVMYTSFLGLIISELVTYGKKDKMC
jgi:hypothetical protein